MNNLNKTKEYIRDAVTNPLERLMKGESGEPTVNLYEKYYWQGYSPKYDPNYKSMLHDVMVPYYELYLNGDTKLCCAGDRLEFIRRKMEYIIKYDDQFGKWASERNLIYAAECWGDNLKRYEKETKRIYRFFHVLEILLEYDCQQEWSKLSDELQKMLFTHEACYDYKTDEVLCVLHAFTMIMQQDWTKERKKEMLDLLYQHWLFLKHYYSVMIRHIIGVKWTNFYKVAETVMHSSQSFKPHMHIFYCGLLDCVDELKMTKKEKISTDKTISLMCEEMQRCEPSELLYPLCDTIFPEDFQRLLREHRPPSYNEILDDNHKKEELIQQLKDQTSRTRKELDKTKEKLEEMVLASIPIEDVDAELELYPAGTAWDMLRDLNANPIICVQKAWRDHFPDLLKKYRERLFGPIEQRKELTEAMMKIAETPKVNCHLEIVQNKETNIDQNYGPNIDLTDGGLLRLNNKE